MNYELRLIDVLGVRCWGVGMVETQLIASLRRNTKKGEHDLLRGRTQILKGRTRGFAPTSCVIECFVLGVAQTHILFLSWHKKSMQKNVKADVPSRPAKCLFTKRRKLAFGSNSSTFLTLISHSGCPVSPHRPICFVLRTKWECMDTNKKGRTQGFAPTIRKLNVCIGCRRLGFVRSTKM